MNQTIKLLHMDNHYASCSNDKKIYIYSSHESHNSHNNINDEYRLENSLIVHESELIFPQNLICE